MQIEDYMKNLRGVNGGKDFDVEFLVNYHLLDYIITNMYH